ncbi:MAG: class I SAM-dependent methyltransferase [Alphaproteobacteria bacterium]
MTGTTEVHSRPDSGSDRYRGEYDADVVARWDALIGWQARRESEGDFFVDLLRRQGARRVLDAACGTGFHAVNLARAGFEVAAADGAAAMVARTRENLARYGLDLPVTTCDWRELDRIVARPFDAILCLGNSIAHLFDEADRKATLAQFHKALAPDGFLIVDHRNYDALLSAGTGSKTRQGYCCCGNDTAVALDVVDDELVTITYRIGGEHAFHLDTFPLRCAQVRDLLERAGFAATTTFGDFRRNFDIDDVEFFVHVAYKATEDRGGDRG